MKANRMLASTVLATAFVCAPSAFASEANDVGLALGITQLGREAPTGFGVTGGPTFKVFANRAFGMLRLGGAVRVFGVERPEPRTVGVEIDCGVGVAKQFLRAQEMAIGVRGQVFVGAYRLPFETALSRMRFIGLRPGVEVALDVKVRGTVGLSVGVDARWYNTPVWTGWSVGVLGGGWMQW